MRFNFYPISRLNAGLQFHSVRCFQASAILVSLVIVTLGSEAIAFEPPPKSGAPKGTSGGGTRPASSSQCVARDTTPLQTLTPPTGVGYTTHQHPKFWVYLPAHKAIELEFTLQSIDRTTTAETSDSYQVMIPAPKNSGWTALALPEDIPALKAQQLYRWSVALVCNPDDRPSSDAVVRGNLIYQPKSTSVLDEIGKIRADYWLDAMSKMSENNRVNWIKFHKVLNQSPDNQTPTS